MSTLPRTQGWEDFLVDNAPVDTESDESYQARITPPERFRRVIDDELVRCLGKLSNACGMYMVLDVDDLQQTTRLITARRKAWPGLRVPAGLYQLTLRCHNGHEERWTATPPERLPDSVPRQRDRGALPPHHTARPRGQALFPPTPDYVRPPSRHRQELAAFNADLERYLAETDVVRPEIPE